MKIGFFFNAPGGRAFQSAKVSDPPVSEKGAVKGKVLHRRVQGSD